MTGERISSLRNSVALVRQASGGAFVAVVALFGASGIGMVVLLLVGNALLHELIAYGDGSGVTARIWWLLVAAVCIAGVVSFANSAGSGMHRLLAERTMRYSNAVVLDVAAYSPLHEFDTAEFHDRLQRAKSNAMSTLQIAMAVPQLISAAVSAVAVMAGLAVISPWLVPITLISAVPLWFTGRANSEEMYSFSFGATPNDRERFHIERIVYSRESAAEVRSFRIAGFLSGRWSELYDERIRGIQQIVRRYIRRSALGSAVGAAVLCGVLVLVLVLVHNGNLSITAAATACVAILLLANRSQQAITSLANLMEHKLYVEDYAELRATGSRLRETRCATVAPFRTLTVDDVSFNYAGASRPALDRVSLTIGAGEVIAIVGRNGSGKTTLAKLLSGLYEPTHGQIRWDSTPVSALTRDGGLAEVGVVFQDFGRYWFSAADNIGVGDVERITDRTGIRTAAQEAGAADFITALADGFDTPLAAELDGGVDLSGGQWQRIAIARVLFRNASFIILDEPTAALDAEAEAALFDTIHELRNGRTVVLISHRFSTVRSADRILVLEDGRLVESGPHEELMALGGRYSRMYELQSRAYVG